MGTLAIRKSVFDNLNAVQKRAVRWCTKRVQIGEFALYQNGGGVQFYVSDDADFDLNDVAILGPVARLIANYSGEQLPAEGPALRQRVRELVAAHVVWPKDIAYTEGGDPWAETLAAQNAPAAVRAGAGVPATWTAVGT